MQKTVSLLLLLATGFILACTGQASTGNLLKNPGFEEASGSLPAGWRTDTYINNNPGITFSREEDGAYAGNAYATIMAVSRDDSKFIQNVRVEPKATYKLSGYIRAQGIPTSQTGATLSVLGPYASSESRYNTEGEWKYTELYGRTGPDQKSVEIAVRLGGYSSDNSGRADFDQLEFVQVKLVPPGKGVVNFYNPPAPATTRTAGQDPAQPGVKVIPLSSITLFALLYFALFIFIYRFMILGKGLDTVSLQKIFITLLSLLGVALVSRMIVAPLIVGYQNDMSCFRAWTAHAASTPFPTFYETISFFDYPPVAVYLFALVGHVNKFFNIASGSGAELLVLKLPSILADVVTAFLIYYVARKRLKASTSLGLAVLYMFNPTVFINSAVWGQMDSVAALLVMLVLFFIVDDKLVYACLMFTAGVFLKWQSGFLILALFIAVMQKIVTGISHRIKTGTPGELRAALKLAGVCILGVLSLLYAVILPFNLDNTLICLGFWLLFILFFLTQRGDIPTKIRRTLAFSGVGLLLLLLVVMFASRISPRIFISSVTWLIGRFRGAMGTYPFATINMFNFYSLLGGNWAKLDVVVGGLTFSTWGLIFACLTLGLSGFLYIFAKERSKYYAVSLLFIAMVVIFYLVMHERYLYPVLMLTLMSLIYTKDKRFAYLFIGYSVTNFYNVAYILDILIRDKFMGPQDPVMFVGAAANVLLTLFLIYVTLDIYLIKPRLAAKKALIKAEV